MATKKSVEAEVSNDRVLGKGDTGSVVYSEPLRVEVKIVGTADMLQHRYDIEVVESKSKSKKNSIEKKTDNVDSYLYRCDDGSIGMPAMNFKSSICDAAKRMPDPSSPRKSARDLFRAGILVHGDRNNGQMPTLGKEAPDYMDKRKVNVQRAAVPRTRPAFKAGWELTFIIEVIASEHIDLDMVHKAVTDAGTFHGLGDYRPDFGRFRIESFKKLTDSPEPIASKKSAKTKPS
jgi:hypothetical protein